MSKINKEVLFIGTYAGEKYLKKLLAQKQYDQLAANQTEKFYINGLGEIIKKIYVLSALVVPSYPKGSLTMPPNYEKIKYGFINNVRFINLPGIRFVSQISELRNAIKKWKARNAEKTEKIIIVYAMRLPFYMAAKFMKKLYPNAVYINIVPDIPIYMHMDNNSLLQRAKSKLNQEILLRESKIFDGFVLYTEAMKDVLRCNKKNSIVIEGIVESLENVPSYVNSKVNSKQIIMYAGGLNRRYGVKLLAEGFISAQIENTELHFYGNGDYAEELKKLSMENPSIKYFGLVSPDQIKKKMKEASLLVNPRPIDEEFTKYSCPSKTLEYMSSGVPFLSSRLQGIPEEYFEYIYSIDDVSISGISNALKMVFCDSLETRTKKAYEAQKFILLNKNEKVQVQKLISFADGLEKQKVNPGK